MDATVTQTARPVYVDLDGTLIRTDLLWESLFLLARQFPGDLWRVPLWAAKGKAHLKAKLAERIAFDASLLPYRESVIAELDEARRAGRRVVLATGANERFAAEIAEHLGIFDDVMASTPEVNLTSHRKLERIVAECGEDGFDYYGNSREDLVLLDQAAHAVVVVPDRAAHRWHKSSGSHRIDDEMRRLRPAVKAMRPHQWMKNLLIFVPIALTHEFFNASLLLAGLAAFFSFSFAASAVYILNDLLDLSSDRRHKTKRMRPFASGRVPIPTGLAMAGGLLAVSIAIALLLPWQFGAALAAYMVATTAYSFFLKRMLLIDVLALASLYTVRIVAGGFAAGVESSFWLLTFSGFFFMSLALVKRFTELQDFGTGAERSKTGRGYVDADFETLAQAGMSSGFVSVLVLALYIQSDAVRELYREPYLIWPLCPIVLYIIVRIWVLARRGEMHEDPVVFMLRDWRSQIVIGLGAMMFLLASYF
ncbi:UbiA family prenyltransferase [Mangrovicella endophytica]|uniref:UbiA family prenyltransferase n=1 Tax=Mangrovicella endophytica TaxID=2066697 RepID=UPI000C9E28A0|nr:UbiA family prenyltransferase [Mangrovicella endophytica]